MPKHPTKRPDTRTLVTLAMLAALAFAAVVTLRIPVVSFLKYEPKDVVLTIGGFLFGPLAGAMLTLVVCTIEMLTISDTGPYGLLMNVIASWAFVCPAALIYRRRHTLAGAVTGLAVGVAGMTAAMLLWNYIITPWYLGMPRQEVAAMLVPMFLPFNLLKAGLNAVITLLLYKPVVLALRRARLLPERAEGSGSKISLGLMLAAGLALATIVLLLLIFMGRL